ncbi:thermonuclease family protein [Candidatus Saccharibacteria bacterium]|jgi:micrococcal nuclease|nr:thermonuclease family protein [Candidatus Saccharibacteria bacterium]
MRYRRRHKYSLVSLILAVLLVVATQSGWLSKPAQVAQQNQPGLYSVAHFVDGDTIDVNMDGRTETVRFIGVDTPETHRPNTPVQCYGPEAAAYTKSIIGSSKLRLQADPLDTNRDRYGRLLRYIFLQDGTLVQEKLVSEGYAFAYTQFPFQKKQQFVDEQAQAKAAKKGLWGACTVTVESNGRQQTNDR